MLARTSNTAIATRSYTTVLGRRAVLLAVAAAALVAIGGRTEAQEMGAGTLLVATADLNDPNFSRSVVLVLRHDDNGTIGVVINRPTRLEPKAVFPELAENIGSYAGALYRGGPVSPAQVLYLVRGLAAATVEGPEIVDKVFLSADPQALPDIVRLAEGTSDLRLYAGHAEWTAGQLAHEIAAGSWTMIDGTAELVFGDPAQLWRELSIRGEGTVAANRP